MRSLTLFKSHCNLSVGTALKGDICLSEFPIHFRSWDSSVMQLKYVIHADDYLLSMMEYPSGSIMHFIRSKGNSERPMIDSLCPWREGSFVSL